MIRIDVDDGGHAGVPVAEIERGIRAACQELGALHGEFSVALLDDQAMARLNQEHLGKDVPTDVISFALYQPGESPLGDVYLGYEQARRQADEENIPLGEELVRLAIHGALHVLGLDHPDAAEERDVSPMYRLQESLVAQVLQGGG